MKKFDNLHKYREGVVFFIADDEKAYKAGKPCNGFGSVVYGEGSVYTGDLYFDGANYNKMGFGRQGFAYSVLGELCRSDKHGEYRRAFYIGQYDYTKTDWIYGNGVFYYTDKDNKPKYFSPGFYSGVNLIGEYKGEFDYGSLAQGYTKDMEHTIDVWLDVFENEKQLYKNVTGDYNLFLGDSYVEFWNYPQFAGETFYQTYSNASNLNLGIGGTRFCDWISYVNRLSDLAEPKNIFVNLGFNDIHSKFTAEQTLDFFVEFFTALKKLFPNSKLFWFGITKSPAYAYMCDEEERFLKLAKQRLSEFDVTLLDGRAQIEQLNKQVNCYAEDLVHINEHGYRVWDKLIAEALNKK